jgi:hypothetical protein
MDRRNFLQAASLQAGVALAASPAIAAAATPHGPGGAEVVPLFDGGKADLSKTRSEAVLIVPRGETGLQYLGDAPAGTVRRLRVSQPIDVFFESGNDGAGPGLTGLNTFIAAAKGDARWTLTPDDSLTMLALDARNKAGERVWTCIGYTDKLVSLMLRPGGEGHRDPADKLFVIGEPRYLDTQPRMPVWGMMVDPVALEGAGKIHTGEIDLFAVGDTTRIRMTALKRGPDGQPMVAGAGWPSALVHRPAVIDPEDGKLDFVVGKGVPLLERSPDSLYQGIAAQLFFDQLDTPTHLSTPGAIVFAVASGTGGGSKYGVTPWNRMWLNGESGNLVVVGKAAFEASPTHTFGEGPSWHSPAGDCDYKSTPGWGNLSIVMTDVADAGLGHNAGLAMRCFGAHGEGVDFGYDAQARQWAMLRVHQDHRSRALSVDLDTGRLTLGGAVATPENPAFEAALGGDRQNLTGDGTAVFLTFDEVAYDRAKELESATGRFVAAAAGVYQLQATIQFMDVGKNDGALVEIVSDRQTRRLAPGVLQPDRNRRAGVSFGAALALGKGETVRVRVTVGGGGRTVGCAARDTVFSGFLVG